MAGRGQGVRGWSPDDLEPRGARVARGAGVPGPSVMVEVVDRRRSPADGQARCRPCSGAALRMLPMRQETEVLPDAGGPWPLPIGWVATHAGALGTAA